MKKKSLDKLKLNKENIATLHVHDLRGGMLAIVASDCEATCTCDCTEVATCGTEESVCLECYSKK